MAQTNFSYNLRYGDDLKAYNYNGTRTLIHKTKHFMVFTEAETCVKGFNFNYNYGRLHREDIEAFCGSTRFSPGLKPNCIYFMGYSFGVYDLTTKTCTTFFEEENYKDDDIQIPLRNLKFPYWPPPVPLY